MKMGAIQLSAMLAALLLSAGLVLRISATLIPVAPETRTDTAAMRAIEVRDSAGGVVLFEGVPLAPGETASRCITVRATGTRVPDAVRMSAAGDIDPMLLTWLDLDLSRGPALDQTRSCDGFREDEVLVRGDAATTMRTLAEGLSWVPSPHEAVPGGHGTSYRIAATLDPEAPNTIQGAQMEFDLTWGTSFDRAGSGLFDQGLALAVRFTEDSMIPMLAVLALAILFLGIQDRLDTATPRLNKAVLFDEVVEFGDPSGERDAVDSPTG
jgi:hypothetical protein